MYQCPDMVLSLLQQLVTVVCWCLYIPAYYYVCLTFDFSPAYKKCKVGIPLGITSKCAGYCLFFDQ